MTKHCIYGCGKTLYWDDDIEGKLKWCEVDTKLKHDYKRCAEILKEQGKQLIKQQKK